MNTLFNDVAMVADSRQGLVFQIVCWRGVNKCIVLRSIQRDLGPGMILLAEDRDRWRVLVNAEMNIQAP
jgi:hypothetical protein